MAKKSFIILMILIGIAITRPQSASGAGELDANYAVNLVIETPRTEENILFVVAGDKFSLCQIFPNSSISFEGKLDLKDNDIIAVDYHLGLKEQMSFKAKTAEKDATNKTEEYQWVDNGCAGRLILNENQQTNFFKTLDRSYTIKISKFSHKR